MFARIQSRKSCENFLHASYLRDLSLARTWAKNMICERSTLEISTMRSQHNNWNDNVLHSRNKLQFVTVAAAQIAV